MCTFFRHPSISMVLPFSWLFSFKPDVCSLLLPSSACAPLLSGLSPPLHSYHASLHPSLSSRHDTIAASSVLSLRMAGSIPFSRRKRNSIDNCVNPEHRSLNDFISPSKTLGADKKGFSSINFRFAFVYRSRANGRIVADHLERYFGEASSTRISAESNI